VLKRKPGRPPIQREPVQSFREFFYSRFPMIPPGQFAILGEHPSETLNRFMSTAADYLDKRA